GRVGWEQCAANVERSQDAHHRRLGVAAAGGAVTTGAVDQRLYADLLWRIWQGFRTSLNDALHGYASLVHDRRTPNRGQSEKPGFVAAFIGCKTAWQLPVQLILVGVLRLHQPDLHTVLGAHDPVAVGDELIFSIFCGNAEERLARTAGAGPWDVVTAVRQLYA